MAFKRSSEVGNKITSAFGSGHKKFGFSIESEYKDQRTLPEILKDWAVHEAAHTAEEFILRTGLRGFIAPDDFRAIARGEKTAGANITTLLELSLPDRMFRKDKEKFDIHSFNSKSVYWRNFKRELPVVDVDKQTINRFCEEKLGDFLESLSIKSAFGTDSPTYAEDSALLKHIISFIQEAAKSQGKTITEEQATKILLNEYSDNHLETLETVSKLLSLHAINSSDAEIKRALEMGNQSIKEVPQEGIALKFLRLSRNLTQKQLSERIGHTQEFLAMLEHGNRKIQNDYAEEVARVLALTPIEKDIFHQIILYSSKKFLQKPEDATVGKLLKFHIDRSGISQKQFAEAIGVSNALVSRWISNERDIDAKKFDAIAHTLLLTPEDKAELIALATAPFPQEKFEAQQERKKAGFLLSYYMKREGIRIEALGTLIETNTSSVKKWISGDSTISPEQTAKITGCLTLSAQESVQFAEQIAISNEHIKEKNKERKKERKAIKASETYLGAVQKIPRHLTSELPGKDFIR